MAWEMLNEIAWNYSTLTEINDSYSHGVWTNSRCFVFHLQIYRPNKYPPWLIPPFWKRFLSSRRLREKKREILCAMYYLILSTLTKEMLKNIVLVIIFQSQTWPYLEHWFWKTIEASFNISRKRRVWYLVTFFW